MYSNLCRTRSAWYDQSFLANLQKTRYKCKQILINSTQQLNELSDRLDDSIERARPYYDARIKAKEVNLLQLTLVCKIVLQTQYLVSFRIDIRVACFNLSCHEMHHCQQPGPIKYCNFCTISNYVVYWTLKTYLLSFRHMQKLRAPLYDLNELADNWQPQKRPSLQLKTFSLTKINRLTQRGRRC